MLRIYLRRIAAFLRGDQLNAEAISDPPDPPSVPWLVSSATSPELADYGREVAKQAAEHAEASVTALQGKAGSLLTFLLAITPASFVVTGFALASRDGPAWARWTAFALFCSADLLLLASALLTFLASGLVLSGGLNPARMAEHAPDDTLSGLMAAEADAWYYAFVLAVWNGQRIGLDLFHARRMVVGALMLAGVGTPLLFIARSA